MRHKVTESRQEIFNHNEHEVSKRWAFEEGVSACMFVFVCVCASACVCARVFAKNILTIYFCPIF